MNSGQRVGLALQAFKPEIEEFGPLKEAEEKRAALVAAIEAKETAQGAMTEDATTGKEQARERMARAADTLSTRAVAYALAAGRLDLKRAFTLSYTDVRHGDADEDVRDVRALMARVRELPAQVRKDYRLTEAVIQAPEDAAREFEAAGQAQTTAKSGTRLASLALPELLRQLSATLRLMQTLLKGQRDDADPRWGELYAAFADANKRREVAGRRALTGRAAKPRIVRTLPVALGAGAARRLSNTNYGAGYTLTVENRAGAPLLLWMAQKDNARTTPQACAAGKVTVLTREALGPETARYLVAQFEGAQGGEATVVVRRAE